MSISNIRHNHTVRYAGRRRSPSLTSTRGGRLRDLDEETKTICSSSNLRIDERFRGEHVLLKRLGTATLVRNKTCTTGIVFVDKLVSQRANKMVLFRTINTWQMFDAHKHIYIYYMNTHRYTARYRRPAYKANRSCVVGGVRRNEPSHVCA